VTDLDDLTQAFVAAHPVDAARELERLDEQDVAALLEQAPARLTAPVLEAMLPTVAARCLALVSPAHATLLLGSLGAPSAASILRHLAEPQRKVLLDALPTAAALACRALLRYPDDAVGALVDTSVVVLPMGATVAEALAAVRRREAETATDVYVVGDDHRLLGVVTLPSLLRAANEVRLRTMLRPAAALPALMPQAGAISHPAWRESSLLPVLEHGGRFLGALSAATLRRAVATRPAPAEATEQSLAGVLGEGYWSAVSSLAQAIVSLLPAPSVGRE
jgi:magnesium transporter